MMAVLSSGGEVNPSPVISSAAEALPSAVCNVSDAGLAVLEADGPFDRDIQATLADTKMGPNGVPLQREPLGANMAGCVFAAHDEAFNGLIGANPTLLRLARKDFPFAHEVSTSTPCACPCFAKHHYAQGMRGHHMPHVPAISPP